MTLYDDLLNAGLPVIDAEEGTTPHFSRILTLDEEDIRDSIMNKPVYEEKITRKQLRDEYLETIATLQQIENATSPTNAQVIQAIKDIAHHQELILKLLRRMVEV